MRRSNKVGRWSLRILCCSVALVMLIYGAEFIRLGEFPRPGEINLGRFIFILGFFFMYVIATIPVRFRFWYFDSKMRLARDSEPVTSVESESTVVDEAASSWRPLLFFIAIYAVLYLAIFGVAWAFTWPEFPMSWYEWLMLALLFLVGPLSFLDMATRNTR